MKIVVCGPPHSGKSVLLANLIEKMPTDAHTIIRACPDGEGNWSNNNNQEETKSVRQKGKFTNTFIENTCKAIDNQTGKIALIDVGGMMSKENEEVFKHCDSFVVLSSDEQKKKEWLEFGEKLGLQCIACLDSRLEGKEEIYTRKPYLQGRVVGLKRGRKLEDSPVINALVSNIIEKSNYTSKGQNSNATIDDTELGFELGYGEKILIENGKYINKVKWKEEAIPKVYNAVKEKLNPEQSVYIYGIRANFILSAICKACKKMNINDIKTYDVRFKQYIPIKGISQKRGLKKTEGLDFNLIENKENAFLNIDITNEQYSLENYEKCVLPRIKSGKNLYISGRIPNWLLASIINSYDSKKIFTFQPGKGFTCVVSDNERDLGTIVDGADGININQYFKDRLENRNNKLPELPQQKGVFSKIKKVLQNVKQNKKNSKYLDETIKSKVITSSNSSNNNQDIFKENIQVDNNPNIQIQKHSNTENAKMRIEENTK